jgi:hypothetical protein
MPDELTQNAPSDILLNLDTGAFSAQKTHKKDTMMSFANFNLLAENSDNIFCDGIPLTIQFGTILDESLLPKRDSTAKIYTNEASDKSICSELIQNIQYEADKTKLFQFPIRIPISTEDTLMPSIFQSDGVKLDLCATELLIKLKSLFISVLLFQRQ